MSAHSKVLNDVIAILETDRVIMKSYNTCIIKFLYKNRTSVTEFRRAKDEKKFEGVTKKGIAKQDDNLTLLWRFLDESFRFMIFGFFKRCIIINDILKSLK